MNVIARRKPPGPVEEIPLGPGSHSSVYINARREWNERYGDYIATARNWRRMAFAATCGMMVAALGVAWIGTSSRIVPYIVEVNKLGDTLAVRRADIAPDVPQRVIRGEVARWIFDVRSVIDDTQTERRLLKEAAAMTDEHGVALTALRDWLEANNPSKESQHKLVDVNVNSVIPISDNTWRVEWTEDTRHRDGAPNERHYWNASITVNIKMPVTDEQVLTNPNGFYVEQFSWGLPS